MSVSLRNLLFCLLSTALLVLAGAVFAAPVAAELASVGDDTSGLDGSPLESDADADSETDADGDGEGETSEKSDPPALVQDVESWGTPSAAESVWSHAHDDPAPSGVTRGIKRPPRA